MNGNAMMDTAAQLESRIKELGSVVVGFSGGVDSTVVAVAAARALGERALAVTAQTETLPTEDLELTRQIAGEFGLRQEIIVYSELDLPGYAENDLDRCYHCKAGLYRHLSRLAGQHGANAILDGAQADDEDDYRPGRIAAREASVLSPLMELGLGKEEVRTLAAHYGLPNAEKPAAPCLSSRIPYGTPVTSDRLEQVARAERALRNLGFAQLRVRHHEDIARVEIPLPEFRNALDQAATIVADLKKCGYRYVTLDLEGFRSGSLNPGLVQISLQEEPG